MPWYFDSRYWWLDDASIVMINDNSIYNVIYMMHPNTRHDMADTPPYIQEDTITTDSTKKRGTKNNTQRKIRLLILSKYDKNDYFTIWSEMIMHYVSCPLTWTGVTATP